MDVETIHILPITKLKAMTYTSTIVYIDLDTGEILRSRYAKKHYLIIKTKKDVKLDRTHGKTEIKYTKLCRKNPQGNLFSE